MNYQLHDETSSRQSSKLHLELKRALTASISAIIFVIVIVVCGLSLSGEAQSSYDIMGSTSRSDSSLFEVGAVFPAHWLTIAGETNGTGDGAPSPGWLRHSALLPNWTREDYEQILTTAIVHFKSRFGVDLSGLPENPDSGSIITPDGAWSLTPLNQRLSCWVLYSSVFGDFYNDPLDFEEEYFSLTALKDSIYRGSFGGQKGIKALQGDQVFVFGQLFDFERNGKYHRMTMLGWQPIRNSFAGDITARLKVISDEFGEGYQTASYKVWTENDDTYQGPLPHLSFRGEMNFPPTLPYIRLGGHAAEEAV